MTCHAYEKFEKGKMEETPFLHHLKVCFSCRQMVEQDERLMKLAKSLNRPIAAPHLWGRIEQRLMEEMPEVKRFKIVNFQRRTFKILRIAAVLVIAVVLGTYFWPEPDIGDSKLLTNSVLNRVERHEKAYMDAIAELEQKAMPRLTQLDVNLMMLYQERLEVIDAQIVLCQEALSRNPANGHIRRYMLAALQDKKETLKEILRS